MAVSLRQLAEAARSGTGRYVDMQVRWVAQDASGAVPANPEVLLDVGGRWDRQAKQWAGPAERVMVLSFHPGQIPAAKWFAEWLRAKARGETLQVRGRPVYSIGLHGGRREGKTDLGCKAQITYGVLRPNSRVWLISENQAKTQELCDAVMEWLPPDWYSYLGAPRHELTLANGSRIWFRSAHDPQDLKRGRCDGALLNEAQSMAEDAFAITRAATADNSGLTILAMNPWSNPIGAWTERFFEEARGGTRQAIEFRIEGNPHVDRESLTAMKDEVDERTYRREIGGEFLPREDVCFHAWVSGPNGNVRPLPDTRDVTREFLRRHLRREFDAVLGVDLQLSPVCAVEVRFFVDPDDPNGEPLIWFTQAIQVEKGYEGDLSSALLDRGYDPERTALIVDASGAYQGIDRQKRIPSFELLRDFGWPHIFRPDDLEDRNPRVIERVRCANALMLNANKKRKLFSVPENIDLNRAIKLWETRNGVPYRRSPYAHLCDAATYPLWRFYPRREVKKAIPPREGARMVRVVDVKPRGIRIL